MNEQQRTPEWYLARKGKITASEIDQVMHKGKKDVFSVGCISYLKEAVADQFKTDDAYLEEKENEPVPFACKHGIFWEDRAREEYSTRTGIIVTDAPFFAMKDNETWSGGSPDGIATDGETTGIIEIKCPRNTAIHFEHYLYKTQEDLKAGNAQYYAQIQMNMMIAGDHIGKAVEFCDFISYDPRVVDGMDLKVLRVYPDVEYQQELRERIALAIDWMKEYRERLINC